MPNTQIFLLAAGNNKYTELPCSLWSLNNKKSILDWQISTFVKTISSDINIVIGYNYQKIINHYPQYNFLHVFDWQNKTSFYSFINTIKNYSRSTLIMYGDTLFHADTIKEIVNINGDVIIAIDSIWQQRFANRSQEDINIAEILTIPEIGKVEYTGLIKLSAKAMQWLSLQEKHYNKKSSFINLINDLQKANFNIINYDVAGNWAELNEPNDLIHFILGNKAETLGRIQTKITKSKICDQITCSWQDWQNDPEAIIQKIQSQFNNQNIIARSSSSAEDGWETANAGVFDSILNIDCNNNQEVTKAINDVFTSYDKADPNAQVLIQPFINNVKISGVIFTCDLVTGSPYYIINYDDNSGRTDSITSGKINNLRTTIVFRHNIEAVANIDARLLDIIYAAQEIEHILGYNKLDIEFAVDQNDQIFTFQIRPITVKHDAYKINEKQFNLFLQSAQKKFNNWQKAPPHILGNYTLFSGMTDWNPAEIIGNKPNLLAISLYNHIITEDIWAQQRAEFGYKDVRPMPLVHNFCSQPYVDCRASINSFIPASIPKDTALRLTNAYLNILKANPNLHDKIELEIVFTIWTPDFQIEAKQRFRNQDVSNKDINLLEMALKKITSKALLRLNKDIFSITKLKKRFTELTYSELEPINKTYHLIEDCRTFGTLAFAHAARAGFIAITILKNLVKMGFLSQERMLQLQSSIPTVASELQTNLANKNISIQQLIKKFGHLRPGTYDINQKAYWEQPDFYFKREQNNFIHENLTTNAFTFTKQEQLGLKNFLDKLNLNIKIKDLINYITQAIQQREETKFEFSRNLSIALDLIIQYTTKQLALTREEAGYLTFEDIKAIRTGQIDDKLLPKLIKIRKDNIYQQQLIKLPNFICCENDFFSYEQIKSQANFITKSSIVAELVFINVNTDTDINNKIIAIPNADPGFDWLFSHKIAGLITQYGGANSHMAIRCAELNIPAAIGIGEKLYSKLTEKLFMLDCNKEIFEYV